jgi:four helix bundle protein
VPNPLSVLDAARSVVADVDRLLDGGSLVRPRQLRESAGSIASNIREAYGQRPGRGRAKFFIHARGSAEETDEHLRANANARRIAVRVFWRLHNRIAVIVKMLHRLIDREDGAG